MPSGGVLGFAQSTPDGVNVISRTSQLRGAVMMYTRKCGGRTEEAGCLPEGSLTHQDTSESQQTILDPLSIVDFSERGKCLPVIRDRLFEVVTIP